MDIIANIMELFYIIAEVFNEPNKTMKQKFQVSALLLLFIGFIILILLLVTKISNYN